MNMRHTWTIKIGILLNYKLCLSSEQAEKDNTTLEIWTGSLGIMTFKTEDGPKEAWLAKHNHTKMMPVPDYVFKVIDMSFGYGIIMSWNLQRIQN